MRVEGIIACLSQETTDFSHFAALKEINMPLILFDRVCLTDQFSSVIADGAQSAQMATQHLLDNGSKRVAYRRCQSSGYCKKKEARLSGSLAR